LTVIANAMTLKRPDLKKKVQLPLSIYRPTPC
jgi:hypothetical protein